MISMFWEQLRISLFFFLIHENFHIRRHCRWLSIQLGILLLEMKGGILKENPKRNLLCRTSSILEKREMIPWLQWITFSDLEVAFLGKNIGRFSSPFVKFVKSKPGSEKKINSVPKAKVSNHDFRRLELVC